MEELEEYITHVYLHGFLFGNLCFVAFEGEIPRPKTIKDIGFLLQFKRALKHVKETGSLPYNPSVTLNCCECKNEIEGNPFWPKFHNNKNHVICFDCKFKDADEQMELNLNG